MPEPRPFQSTPANFTAGDGPRQPVARPGHRVSIHARQFHSGRRTSAPPLPLAPLSFQSTPANFTAGDLRFHLQCPAVALVSIHARQFHSGRLGSSGATSREPAFQSTPANFTAGDARPATTAARLPGFNPRPPISQRATHRGPGRRADWAVSIHARQFHSGRRGRCG